jgi:hypothetical protein
VLVLNPLGLGALVYVNVFTRSIIYESEEASIGFPWDFFLGDININVCVCVL